MTAYTRVAAMSDASTSQTAGPAIKLVDVSHIFGETAVLRHVELELLAGRCYLLLGANGAGKSTLLRILAGLLRSTQGHVLLWGYAPSEVRARIGYMAHAPMLYEELSAIENLQYFAALYPSGRRTAPAAALAAVALDPGLGKPLSAYSQGMRQRVSLARVLLTEPDLLLLDEPFSNMDAESARGMLKLLGEERSKGRTIVLSTHQREIAETLADELLLLEAGELQRASPQHL